VIAVSSLTFFITGFQSVPTGLLQRNMDFRRLSIAEAAMAMVQAAVLVALAWGGYGYWALIWSVVAGKGTNAALLLWWKPLGFKFPHWKKIRPALDFGRNAAVGNLATTAYWHSDVLVVGRMMGPAALGTYRMALYLATAPAEKISMLIMRTAGPLFANVQADLALARRYFLLFADTIALFLIPAMVGLIMVAPEAVRVVLGPKKWDGAVQPLIWLACYMIVATLGSLVTQVLTSRRMTVFTMRVALVNLAVMPVALILGAHFGGTPGVAAAWVIAAPLTALPSAIVLFRRIELTWRDFLATLWPAVSGAIAMAAGLFGVRFLMSAHSLAPALRLAIQVVTGAATYSAVLMIFFREKVWRYVRFLRGFRENRAAAAETAEPAAVPPL
jgi:O-antigen/teichoic acid export membrane protein